MIERLIGNQCSIFEVALETKITILNAKWFLKLSQDSFIQSQEKR